MNDIAELFGIFLGFCLVVGIPAIAILTVHQRKMTELIHKNRASANNDELLQSLDVIQRQLDEMKDRQNALILQRYEETPPPTPKVEDRMQE